MGKYTRTMVHIHYDYVTFSRLKLSAVVELFVPFIHTSQRDHFLANANERRRGG